MAENQPAQPSKAQLDRLGERLRLGTDTEDDVHMLDDYRKSFRPAYEQAAATIRNGLAVDATGREAKTVSAITQKLRRQSIRLTQIQDIAGLRIVVADQRTQQTIVGMLMALFGGASVDDRRSSPSHGYRAIHAIVQIDGKPVEVQVRTQDQHLWAELSERISDAIDPAVKYGGGPDEVRALLGSLSSTLARIEGMELKADEPADRLFSLRQRLHTGATLPDAATLSEIEKYENVVGEADAQLSAARTALRTTMQSLIAAVKAKGRL